MPQCAPPTSLTTWANALLFGVVALALVALAFAPLSPRRWRSRRAGALGLLGMLIAIALAGWSLALRARLLAIYGALAASYQANGYYCVYGGMHGGSGVYPAWVAHTAQMIGPPERAALVTCVGVIAVFLLVTALALRAWLRRIDPSARSATQPAPELEFASEPDGQLHITALDPRAPRIWRLWAKRTRLALAVALLVAIAAGAVVGVTLRNRSASATLPACSDTLTTRILSELPGLGFDAHAASDSVAVISEQAALSAVNHQIDLDMRNVASCLVAQAMSVDTGQTPLITEQNVWAIAYHIPAHGGSAGASAVPFDMWGFVDSTTGNYLSGGSALTP